MAYISYFTSRYYPIFVELGYPQLDVREITDGSWCILEMMRSPVIPSLTKWRDVLGPIKHVEISKGFIQKYVTAIDTMKDGLWDRERKKTRDMLLEKESIDRRREDLSNRAFLAMRQNPALMERIAKYGLAAMDLNDIAKHAGVQNVRSKRKHRATQRIIY